MTIPIFINNRNRYSSTRAMVEKLLGIPECVPIIVDNDSSYPPLLDWYAQKPCEILMTGINGGTLAVYNLPGFHPVRLKSRYGCELFGMTDPDLDISAVPADFIQVLAEAIWRWPHKGKAGLSLEIEDVGGYWKEQVIAQESPFWKKRIDGTAFWDAPIDTTFFLARVGSGFSYNAVRADRPYTARHLPWYVDPGEMSEEERYYLEHARAHGTMWTARAKEVIK